MSISIIGGADGPTQIFVTSSLSSYTTIAAIAIVCIAAVATIVWKIRKGKNKN
ncbi:MAG: sodium ion-translocating decarboxylase subunit beta [Firmicutes bacterium]|jgi:Na+-transporting methylmalonyl-CoA/oxaloacetate decarboxylase beta subunit|nr:sodium ion-translocating decarboxylase subunit beta [Bacillota bacterium]